MPITITLLVGFGIVLFLLRGTRITPFKSIFCEPVDQFFIRKLIVALFFIYNFCQLFLAMEALAGVYHPKQGSIASSPWNVVWYSTIRVILLFWLFRWIEHRRGKAFVHKTS